MREEWRHRRRALSYRVTSIFSFRVLSDIFTFGLHESFCTIYLEACSSSSSMREEWRHRQSALRSWDFIGRKLELSRSGFSGMFCQISSTGLLGFARVFLHDIRQEHVAQAHIHWKKNGEVSGGVFFVTVMVLLSRP